MFLDLVLMIVSNYRTVERSIISELLKIIDAQPVDGHYTFRLTQVSKATRILHAIMRNNFEEFNAVERIIKRLNSEIKIIKESATGSKLSDWRCIQCPEEIVHKTHRQELIRVLFRLLNSCIFKNDPNQGNFNPNFVSNSRKILDSELFSTALTLFDQNVDANSDTHDVVYISVMHLMALVLNDLPAQIPKACDNYLPHLFQSLEKRVPNYNNFYLSMLKLIASVSIHDKGRQCFKDSNLIEKIIFVPIEPDYGYNFINCERTYEYNSYLRDLLKNDDDLLKRATNQMMKNVDYIVETCTNFTKDFLSMTVEERKDLYDSKLEICTTRRNITDQIDTFFSLFSHIITDVSGGFQHIGVEQKICTPEMFEKILEIFNIPLVSDVLAKDNIIFRDVFKSFINEHPKLFEVIHKNLRELLDQVEGLIGPLKDAVDFVPLKDPDTVNASQDPVTTENVRSLAHSYTNNERLEYLYCLIKNYCSLIRGSVRKIHGFLELDIHQTLERLSCLRKAIIVGGSKLYGNRLREEYAKHQESIEAFDQKVASEECKQSQESNSQQDEANEVIGKLSKEDYNKKYKKIDDCNYCSNSFTGVLEFDDKSRSNTEREAEICQSEVFRLIQLCWKKKVANERSDRSKKNIQAIVDAVINMTDMFNQDELDRKSKLIEENKIDQHELMATFVKYNQAIEECSKLVSSDSPYITNFYMNNGFKNIISLYHWLRKVTPQFENLTGLRIIFSKHLQLLWSNLGDLFASVIECKFMKEAREVYALVTEKHKTESEFVCSLNYHVGSEIFKQDDIITFFLKHSKFFLECLIDIMKMMINEDDFFKDPVQRDNRMNRFGMRGALGEQPRAAPMQHSEEAIGTLRQLGFTRRRVLEALNRTQGNVDLSAEYLLSLPPEVVMNDQNAEQEDAQEKSSPKKDAKMEEDEAKDDKMEVDNDGIYVKTFDELEAAIKTWLEVLYKWVLEGFNSQLTDVDVDNITLFILKYISKPEDIADLMKTLLESLDSMFNQLKTKDVDSKDPVVLSDRKACMKKAVTLSKIVSHLNKNYLENMNFIQNLCDFFRTFFDHFKDQPIDFLEFDHEFVDSKDIADTERLKSESEIFKDIVDNCLNILIASYGFFKLSCADELTESLQKSIDKESKGEEVKKEAKDDFKSSDKNEEKLIMTYFKELGALENIKENVDDSKELDKLLQEWRQAFSEDRFIEIAFLMIEHAEHSFDTCFTQTSFNKFLFFLLKLLDDEENVKNFQSEQMFKKLINLKSAKRKIIDHTKSYLIPIVNRLVEDEGAILNVTENIIKKCLYFKHDEEFTKEIRDKAKDSFNKKKTDKAQNTKDSKQSKERQPSKDRDTSKERRPSKEPQEVADQEEQKETPDQPEGGTGQEEEKDKTDKKKKRSGSHDLAKHKSSSKPKSVIKKSDISYNAFKNCSGIKLQSFITQLKFLSERSTKVFLKACKNLCEIEIVKQYDTEMNVKSETKIIKLKDDVLKDYISKVTKESSAEQKQTQAEKKDLAHSPALKSTPHTARLKQHSTVSAGAALTSKDSFLKSSMKATTKFLPKQSQYIIFLLLGKILDKF